MVSRWCLKQNGSQKLLSSASYKETPSARYLVKSGFKEVDLVMWEASSVNFHSIITEI